MSAQPLEVSKFQLGQPVAFIYSRVDCVPAAIKAINPDGTYDLEALIPIPSRNVVWSKDRTTYTTPKTVELTSTPFLKARLCDPTTIFTKKLFEASASERVRGEWDASVYIDTGRRVRVPRFHEFHTCIIGNFFDPSPYYYRVTCWRAPVDLRTEKIPEETRTFPNPDKKPYYTNFIKTFDRYFREYYRSRGKWNRVQIQVFHRDDVSDVAITEVETKIEKEEREDN